MKKITLFITIGIFINLFAYNINDNISHWNKKFETYDNISHWNKKFETYDNISHWNKKFETYDNIIINKNKIKKKERKNIIYI